jgi:hypothetical protein
MLLDHIQYQLGTGHVCLRAHLMRFRSCRKFTRPMWGSRQSNRRGIGLLTSSYRRWAVACRVRRTLTWLPILPLRQSVAFRVWGHGTPCRVDNRISWSRMQPPIWLKWNCPSPNHLWQNRTQFVDSIKPATPTAFDPCPPAGIPRTTAVMYAVPPPP